MGLPFVDLPNLFIDDPYFFYLPDEKIAPAVLCRGFFFLYNSVLRIHNSHNTLHCIINLGCAFKSDSHGVNIAAVQNIFQ